MKYALMINFEKNQIVMTRQFAKKCTDTRSPQKSMTSATLITSTYLLPNWANR